MQNPPSMRSCLNTLSFCLLANTLFAQDSLLSKSDIVSLDFKILADKKTKLASKDPSLLPAYEQLLNDADKLLSYKPVSVMDKTGLPPSGDKHDYMSIAPYFWPDPSKPDGLPYINKDGQHNPESSDERNTNGPAFARMSRDVETLALAWYFTG